MRRRGPRLRTSSIRLRLAILAGAAALTAVVAAFSLVEGLRASDAALERAFTARGRLDLLASLSGRLSDYGLAAVAAASSMSGANGAMETARGAVVQAFHVVAAAGGAVAIEPAQLARVSADFDLLDRQIAEARRMPDTIARTDTVKGALNAFAASAGPQLSSLVDAERREIERTRAAARTLSERLQWGAAAAAVLAILLMVALHRRITGPLVGRIAEIEAGAAAVGRGQLEIRIAGGGRDELGLLVAQFNRMAARLARRERRVVADRAALERTIADRTADLQAANARLTTVDGQRRRFFADVSHELRTPLTVILGECDVALRGLAKEDGPLRAAFLTIRGRAQRLHRRVGDMLRVARSASGEIELDREEISLNAVLEEAIDGFARHAARRGIALTLVHGPTDPLVLADREWLRQVVEGLIGNAFEHAKGATRIELRGEETADAVSVILADDGCGIAPEALPGLFERFARTDGGEKSGGFGIGLALARWVVERHGGTIGIAPVEPHGTDVRIRLPKVPAYGDAHGSGGLPAAADVAGDHAA